MHDAPHSLVNLNAARTDPLALYVHWPFCVSKCPYCDFNSHVRETIDEAAWLDALLADMQLEAKETGNRALGSIFFGGGTPSLMPPRLVERLIDAASRHWSPVDGCEITLEANPSSVEAGRFADLARAGVNRVSLGVQSFDDEALRFLGRAHGVHEALAAVNTAQDCFARVSFDLIYALPGQSLDDWRAMLERALAIGTGHLSLYQLTIEPGTRFETLVRQGVFVPADDDHGADLFALTADMTRTAGLPAYEISNHAWPGEESRHNLTYWRYGDYAGIGPGAHGRRNGIATVRHRKPENYLAGVDRNNHGLASTEQLSAGTMAMEALLMGLRLAEGIDVAGLVRRFGFTANDLIDEDAVVRLAGLGLVEQAADRLTVTAQGMPLLDAILPQIVAIEPEAVA
ncbi:MAG: radical SAM family heme chaperone HemW [Blastomonas sp.]